jgi:hypothetical protein
MDLAVTEHTSSVTQEISAAKPKRERNKTRPTQAATEPESSDPSSLMHGNGRAKHEEI